MVELSEETQDIVPQVLSVQLNHNKYDSITLRFPENLCVCF